MLYYGWIHKPYSMIWTERTWGGERGPGGFDWNEWRMNGWMEEGEQGGPREEGSVVLSGPALSGRPLVQIYTSDPDAFISAQRERRSHAAGRGYTERKQAVRGSNRQRWPANTRGGEAGGCHSVNTTQSTEAMMCSLWGGKSDWVLACWAFSLLSAGEGVVFEPADRERQWDQTENVLENLVLSWKHYPNSPKLHNTVWYFLNRERVRCLFWETSHFFFCVFTSALD